MIICYFTISLRYHMFYDISKISKAFFMIFLRYNCMLFYNIINMIYWYTIYFCLKRYHRYPGPFSLQHVWVTQWLDIARGYAASKCGWKRWHHRRFFRRGIDVTRRRRTRWDGCSPRWCYSVGLVETCWTYPIILQYRFDWMFDGLRYWPNLTSRMWQCSPKRWEMSLRVQAVARVLPFGGEWWPKPWCAQIVEASWARDQHFCQEKTLKRPQVLVMKMSCHLLCFPSSSFSCHDNVGPQKISTLIHNWARSMFMYICSGTGVNQRAGIIPFFPPCSWILDCDNPTWDVQHIQIDRKNLASRPLAASRCPAWQLRHGSRAPRAPHRAGCGWISTRGHRGARREPRSRSGRRGRPRCPGGPGSTCGCTSCTSCHVESQGFGQDGHGGFETWNTQQKSGRFSCTEVERGVPGCSESNSGKCFLSEQSFWDHTVPGVPHCESWRLQAQGETKAKLSLVWFGRLPETAGNVGQIGLVWWEQTRKGRQQIWQGPGQQITSCFSGQFGGSLRNWARSPSGPSARTGLFAFGGGPTHGGHRRPKEKVTAGSLWQACCHAEGPCNLDSTGWQWAGRCRWEQSSIIWWSELLGQESPESGRVCAAVVAESLLDHSMDWLGMFPGQPVCFPVLGPMFCWRSEVETAAGCTAEGRWLCHFLCGLDH